MGSGKMEKQLILVPLAAKQVREIQDLESWVEPSIWTIRMLAALVTGVKGGKWYKKWPNTYFSKLGLFSLTAARDAASQSAQR